MAVSALARRDHPRQLLCQSRGILRHRHVELPRPVAEQQVADGAAYERDVGVPAREREQLRPTGNAFESLQRLLAGADRVRRAHVGRTGIPAAARCAFASAIVNCP